MTAAAPQFRTEALIEKVIRGARDHFHLFAPLVVRDTKNVPIEYAPLHFSWVAHVNYAWGRGLDAGIFSHWGSGKSSGFAAPLIAWLIGRDPTIRIKIICAGDTFAAERVDLVRQILESPAYARVFPGIRPGGKWNEHMLIVGRHGHAADPTLEGRGVFSKGVGGRANYLFFDDVCDWNNSGEDKGRERVKSAISKVWMGRLEERGTRDHALWIATPWHLDDMSYALRASPSWCWLEQRVRPDKTALEQEVVNAGPDYAAFQAESIRAMLGQ